MANNGKGITRRQFISSVSGAVITIMGSDALSFFSKESEKVEGGKLVERWVPNACHQCPSGCGIVVRVVNGVAVKIEGNKLHPTNRGKLCPKGQIGIQLLYDPDRITSPLRRTNPKKGLDQDPKFVPVSWDRALNDIAQRMRKLRENGEAHTFAMMGGRYRGINGTLADHFTKLFGSPNAIGHSSICADASKRAHAAADGNYSYTGYDYERCRYFLNFGSGLLEAFRPTTLVLRAYGNMRGRGTKIVHFDTRQSVTASKADEWFGVNPGTDGSVAMAMAHVIVTEGLWNRKFVGDFTEPGLKFEKGLQVDPEHFKEIWTLGLVDWWNNELMFHTPEKAQADSGVPAAAIRRIAREFARTPGAIATGERGAGAHTNGTYSRYTIHALNGLVGSMFAEGGLFYQAKPPYEKWPVDEKNFMDDIAKESTKQTKIDKSKSKEMPLTSALYQNIADNHLNSDPYRLKMVMTYYTNPLFSAPNPQRFERAFKDVFLIETSSYLSETALYADYILPDHSYLEKLLDDPIYPSLGYPVTALRSPAVKPLYNTKDFVDVLFELGKRIGGRMGEYFTELKSGEAVIRHLAKGLPISYDEWKRDGVWSDPKGYPYTQKDGVFRKGEKEMSAEEVKKDLFKTKSGKFEFRSSMLEEKGYNPFPRFERPKFATRKGFDLHLNSPKYMAHAEGRSANVPQLQQIFDVTVKTGWKTALLINPTTAKERGIADGTEVWIESPVAKIKVLAKHFAGCMPKVVVLPYERGHTAFGRHSKGRGVNPNLLIVNLTDPISGQSCTNATMVKVYPA